MPRTADAAFRRGPRIVLAIFLLLAIGGLYAVLVAQLRSATETDTQFIAAERRGVAYLGPAIRLVAELTRAQSAAVRGAAPNTPELNAAVAAVAQVETVHGASLQTGRRWTDLRTQITRIATDRPTGEAALERYPDVVTLAIELMSRVGDTSNLILDPQLDSYYLMDAALLRLPIVLASAGLAADHAYLAARRGDEGGTATMEIVVARHDVASATQALTAGLRKTLDATERSTLGPSVTVPLDSFRSATDQLVPPAALQQTLTDADADAISAAAAQVKEAAVPLAAAVLSELDSLLSTRQEALRIHTTIAIGIAAAGTLLGVVLLWWSVPAPRARTREDLGVPVAMGDVASVEVTLPAVDARDLLAVEELVHVGRGVRARPKDEADDAQ